MRKVLILGGDSDYNLGDAAILAAVCENLTTRGNVEIAITSNRADQRFLRGVTRVVRRGFAGTADLMSAAHQADLIVVGGGGLFQDDDSRIKMPYWASRLGALRLLNNKIVGHCLGAGPLQHADSRRFAAYACTRLNSISVRDAFAHKWLAPCSRRPIDVVPDPAFMLTAAPAQEADAVLRTHGLTPGKPLIGVALRRWFHRRGGFVPMRLRVQLGLAGDDGRSRMSELLERLSTEIASLARRIQASVVLLPSYTARYENDVEVCRELATTLRSCDAKLINIQDPTLYKAVCGRLSLMVSARMHPLILAASMGVPVVGLAYNGKFEGLFDLLGVPKRLVWLDRLVSLPAHILEELAGAACSADDDLRQRAARLAEQVAQRTSALLDCEPRADRYFPIGSADRPGPA
jgi:polysaccharide pyruvyl transferase WcaK-like protein